MSKKLIVLNLADYISYKTITFDRLAYVEKIALNAPVALNRIPIPQTYYLFELDSVYYKPQAMIQYEYNYKIIRTAELQE